MSKKTGFEAIIYNDGHRMFKQSADDMRKLRKSINEFCDMKR